MRAYYYFNRIQNSILTAFVISSVFIIISELLNIINYYVLENSNEVIKDFVELLIKIVPYIFCYFITQYYVNKNRRIYIFWSLLCLAVFHTAYCGNISYIVGVIIALLTCLAYNNFDKYTALIITPVASAIFGVLFAGLASYFSSNQMTLAYAISKKGIITSILFAVIKTILSLFGSNSFSELFFYKSYGGSIIIGDELITGVKDLFENGYSGPLISQLMSGNLFLLFAIIGVMLLLCDELKGAQKITFIVVSTCAVLSGNISLFLLFLFLESWHLLISFVLISALAYLSAAMLDLSIGYNLNGSIIEMIMNINKPVYAVLGGLVFVAIGYFVAKYNYLRFGISDSYNVYYPTKYNKIVNSFGGIVNIIKIDGDLVEVRNPKLINTFDLDCQIKENIVKTDSEEVKELGEYLK